jgi:hypothetical protein
MKSLKSSIAMAAAILATTGMVGAHAADEQKQAASQPATDSTQVAPSAQPQAKPESKQFEFFENELYRMSVPSYTPSEHPDAKPAPKSAHQTPSVFDNPLNTSSLG